MGERRLIHIELDIFRFNNSSGGSIYKHQAFRAEGCIDFCATGSDGALANNIKEGGKAWLCLRVLSAVAHTGI